VTVAGKINTTGWNRCQARHIVVIMVVTRAA
jgi:hypothetical protein